MKRNSTIVFATLLVIVLFQISSFRLQSHIEFPPAGGLAGDPHQTNCGACHSTLVAVTNRNSQFILRIAPDSAMLGNPGSIVTGSSSYTPNHPNWVSLELTGVNTNSPPDTGWYGFQFTALKANDSMAGTFTLVDPHTSRQDNSFTQLSGGVAVPAGDTIYYVGHYNPTLQHYIQQWYFIWNAPDSSAGAITFYYAGNMGNGNRQADISLSNTDSIFLGSTTLTPGPPSTVGIADVAGNIHAVSVYPVPFSNQLNANLYFNTPSNVSIMLMSIDGQAIRDLYDGPTPQGHFSRSFEIGSVAAGMYFVRIQSGADTKVVKVLKY
jgi:hypothetical protein